MKDISAEKMFMDSFNILLTRYDIDTHAVSLDLHASILKVLQSLPAYKEVLNDLRGKQNEVKRVREIINRVLKDFELNRTDAFLHILEDTTGGNYRDATELGVALGIIGASEEVRSHNGRYDNDIQFKTDLARSYAETIDKIYKVVKTKLYLSEDVKVSYKRQLESFTIRILDDLSAYKEILVWGKGKKVEIELILEIGVFSPINFDKVDTLLRILLIVGDSRKLLTAKEIQLVLESIDASPLVVEYSNY